MILRFNGWYASTIVLCPWVCPQGCKYASYMQQVYRPTCLQVPPCVPKKQITQQPERAYEETIRLNFHARPRKEERTPSLLDVEELPQTKTSKPGTLTEPDCWLQLPATADRCLDKPQVWSSRGLVVKKGKFLAGAWKPPLGPFARGCTELQNCECYPAAKWHCSAHPRGCTHRANFQ